MFHFHDILCMFLFFHLRHLGIQMLVKAATIFSLETETVLELWTAILQLL